MQLILKFNGDIKDFQNALVSYDDNFNIFDNVFYQMDYEKDSNEGIHHTQYGDIIIIFKEANK